MAMHDALPTESGSFRLFHAAGIDVFVHWSWLVAAYFLISDRPDYYESPVWKVIEYLTLFGIVLLHEFGHALACRQVGGTANQIVLWPLGGVAYVDPPPRPGAVLWSIAAGPLVNFALIPVTIGCLVLLSQLPGVSADARLCAEVIMYINIGLLVFNLLPVYPLDGGQILRALLWFAMGPATSLLVVSIIGVMVGAAAVLLAVLLRDPWMGIVAAFVVFQAFNGFQHARLLAKALRIPRHQDAACPSCGVHPPQGEFWRCGNCERQFDTFEHHAICPGCGAQFPTTGCPACNQFHPIGAWFAALRASEQFERDRA